MTRSVFAMLVMIAGMSACDRKDPAPTSATEQRKPDDTAYRLEAEANQLADDIEKLDKKIDELAKHAPTEASSTDEVQEYKDQLQHLNSEKTTLMMRIDALDRAVAAQKQKLGSDASE